MNTMHGEQQRCSKSQRITSKQSPAQNIHQHTHARVDDDVGGVVSCGTEGADDVVDAEGQCGEGAVALVAGHVLHRGPESENDDDDDVMMWGGYDDVDMMMWMNKECTS